MTAAEVKEEEEKLIKKSFENSRAKFEEFLKTSGYTVQDVNERLKVQVISQATRETAGRRSGRRETEQRRNQRCLRR